MNRGRCSGCGADLFWHTIVKKGGEKTGHLVELEAILIDPNKAGDVAGYNESGQLVRGFRAGGTQMTIGVEPVKIRESHFAHCPKAQNFRKKKEK